LRVGRGDGEDAVQGFEHGPYAFILSIHFLYETACGVACQPKGEK
jgi:hypothetical protein